MNQITINGLTLIENRITASDGVFTIIEDEIEFAGRVDKSRSGHSVVVVENLETRREVRITAAQRKEIEAWIQSLKKQPEVDPVDQILNEDEPAVEPEQTVEPELDPNQESGQVTEELLPQQELSFETKLAIEAVAAIASLTRETLATAGTDVLGTIDAAIKALAAVRATKPAAQRQPRASNGPTCKDQVIELLKEQPRTVAELTKITGRYYSQVLAVVNALIKEGRATKIEKTIGLVVDSF